MYEQQATIAIQKVANGFCVILPFAQPKNIMDDPEAYGAILKGVAQEIRKDVNADDLGFKQEKEAPKKKERPAIDAMDNIFLFLELQEAIDFVKFKLEH